MKLQDPSLKLMFAPDGRKWIAVVAVHGASCRWYLYDPDGGFIAMGFALSYGEGHDRARRAAKRRWDMVTTPEPADTKPLVEGSA